MEDPTIWSTVQQYESNHKNTRRKIGRLITFHALTNCSWDGRQDLVLPGHCSYYLVIVHRSWLGVEINLFAIGGFNHVPSASQYVQWSLIIGNTGYYILILWLWVYEFSRIFYITLDNPLDWTLSTRFHCINVSAAIEQKKKKTTTKKRVLLPMFITNNS